jgi:hypothetical protein
VSAEVPPRERYRLRAAGGAAELADLEARSRRLSFWRGVLFVGGGLAVLLGDRLPGVPAAWWTGGGLALLTFAWLVRLHRALRRRMARTSAAVRLALEGVARVDRRWDDLSPPAPVPEHGGPDHPYARDLDVYGRASLRSLMGPVATPMGAARLDGWLLGASSPGAPWERQAMVRELAGLRDLREAASVEAALLEPVDEAVPARFLAWLQERPTVRGSLLDRVRWALPAATAGFVALHLAGYLPAAPWVVLLLVQAGVAWRAAPALHASFARASSGAPGLRRYHRLFAVWEPAEVETPPLVELVETVRSPAGTRPASDALRHLARLLDAADARFSGMLHPVLAVGLLWDLHVASKLDAWRAGEGASAPAWIEALGRLEALSALATLAADHPDWCWPEPGGPGPPLLRARALGHPLLPETSCVRNDVEVGPPGTVLLVTGSNMSGKSTLLRSIGTAVVLARAGAPVCAVGFSLPPVRLFTSMRVEDSLEAGVSFFMAELERLRRILEAAPTSDEPEETPLLYLVDEMLHGTNSQERQAAGRRVIRHLLRRRAIGAVTTHDLDLHRDPEVEAAARLVHFQESVRAGEGAPALSFDYRLRKGLATTRNALLLAERMGITDPGPAPARESTDQRTTP